MSDGLVTLKGPVRSDADKKAIGQKVDEIAGAKNVMNNLFVSTENEAGPGNAVARRAIRAGPARPGAIGAPVTFLPDGLRRGSGCR